MFSVVRIEQCNITYKTYTCPVNAEFHSRDFYESPLFPNKAMRANEQNEIRNIGIMFTRFALKRSNKSTLLTPTLCKSDFVSFENIDFNKN